MTAREPLPEWEAVLRAAARLQGILPDATLVGGTAAAPEAGHRRSMDADHVIGDLIDRSMAALDHLYPQPDDAAAVRQQLMRQLAHPQPYDLEEVGSDLAEYQDVAERWNTWDLVAGQCAMLAVAMAEAVATRRTGWTDLGGSS